MFDYLSVSKVVQSSCLLPLSLNIKPQWNVYSDFHFLYSLYVVSFSESGSEPHIVAIEKLWKDENDGEMWLRGNWFLRPKETYHVATKKFLEKEVFKSDFCDSVPFSKMVGKCFVMSVKEYYKLKPEVRFGVNS